MLKRRHNTTVVGEKLQDDMGKFSPWAWVERLYNINMETVERITVVESRVDRIEAMLANNDMSAVKVEVAGLKRDLDDLLRARKEGTDLTGKIKYDVIRIILTAVMGAIGAAIVLGVSAWVSKMGSM